MIARNQQREEAHAVRQHPDPQGHPQERKDEIARRVTAAISEVARAAEGSYLGRVRGCHGRRLVRRRRRA